MTSAALVDLRTRILSNTLTGIQQQVLALALSEIDAQFPSPDETSATNVPPDESFARTWISALYSIQQLFAGGSAVLPTNQTNWYINATTGSDTNAGTSPSAPLQSIAALAALWKGVAGGGRPQLSPATGNTITVTLQTDMPPTDPLAPILDVDLVGGADLIIVGGLAPAAHTGTIATASTFARTSAGGRISITDAAVSDFHPLTLTPFFVDATSGAVCWLNNPLSGSSATGTLCVGYSAVTPGNATPGTQTTIAAADTYSLARPLQVTWGTGFVTRGFPTMGAAGSAPPSAVYVYRLELENPSVGTAVYIASPSTTFVLQECIVGTEIQANAGATVILMNCDYFALELNVEQDSIVELINGTMPNGVVSVNGGLCVVDGDFALTLSFGAFLVSRGGSVQIGLASCYTTGINALSVAQGQAVFSPFLYTGSVFYGTDGGTPLAIPPSNAASATILYFNDSSGTPAQNNFKFTHSTFAVGDAASSSFGFNESTGAYIGPTTNTFAHLDASLGSGTGFGGAAIDPKSGSILRLAA